MKVQLLYFDGCPNVDAARAAVGQALANTGIEARVEELDVNAETTPEALRGWGSPTILINGKDVGGEREATGCSCRMYRGDSGERSGAPDVVRIGVALRGVAGSDRSES
jgi:mercuric ion transport protein